MAAPLVRQWICHSPNVMKIGIFAGTARSESGKSTRGVADLIHPHWVRQAALGGVLFV
jgi:hypothetical protein